MVRTGQVAKLLIAGLRGEAHERWPKGIGLAAEVITGMRDSPLGPALEATALTLIYDGLLPAHCEARTATVSRPQGRRCLLPSRCAG